MLLASTVREGAASAPSPPPRSSSVCSTLREAVNPFPPSVISTLRETVPLPPSVASASVASTLRGEALPVIDYGGKSTTAVTAGDGRTRASTKEGSGALPPQESSSSLSSSSGQVLQGVRVRPREQPERPQYVYCAPSQLAPPAGTVGGIPPYGSPLPNAIRRFVQADVAAVATPLASSCSTRMTAVPSPPRRTTTTTTTCVRNPTVKTVSPDSDSLEAVRLPRQGGEGKGGERGGGTPAVPGQEYPPALPGTAAISSPPTPIVDEKGAGPQPSSSLLIAGGAYGGALAGSALAAILAGQGLDGTTLSPTTNPSRPATFSLLGFGQVKEDTPGLGAPQPQQQTPNDQRDRLHPAARLLRSLETGQGLLRKMEATREEIEVVKTEVGVGVTTAGVDRHPPHHAEHLDSTVSSMTASESTPSPCVQGDAAVAAARMGLGATPGQLFGYEHLLQTLDLSSRTSSKGDSVATMEEIIKEAIERRYSSAAAPPLQPLDVLSENRLPMTPAREQQLLSDSQRHGSGGSLAATAEQLQDQSIRQLQFSVLLEERKRFQERADTAEARTKELAQQNATLSQELSVHRQAIEELMAGLQQQQQQQQQQQLQQLQQLLQQQHQQQQQQQQQQQPAGPTRAFLIQSDELSEARRLLQARELEVSMVQRQLFEAGESREAEARAWMADRERLVACAEQLTWALAEAKGQLPSSWGGTSGPGAEGFVGFPSSVMGATPTSTGGSFLTSPLLAPTHGSKSGDIATSAGPVAGGSLELTLEDWGKKERAEAIGQTIATTEPGAPVSSDLRKRLEEVKAQMGMVEEQGLSLRQAAQAVEKDYNRVGETRLARGLGAATAAPTSPGTAFSPTEESRSVSAKTGPGSRIPDQEPTASKECVVELLPAGMSKVGIAGATDEFQAASLLLRFNKARAGANLLLSPDGITATRAKGCRQSVAFSVAPVPLGPLGFYFAVEVRSVVNGWVGGLGLGVTQTDPEKELKRIPDKPMRMPNTFVAGYWGRIFCVGREYRTKWKADDLKPGQRVGLLVTLRGEVMLFVDGVRKIFFADSSARDLASKPLFAVVDVFASTSSIALVPGALPPAEHTWQGEDEGLGCLEQLTPPDSPCSSRVSTLSFMADRADLG